MMHILRKSGGVDEVHSPDNILYNFCVASPQLRRDSVLKLFEFFKGIFFTVYVTDWQDSYIINGRDSLKNLTNHHCGFFKIVVEREESVSEYFLR